MSFQPGEFVGVKCEVQPGPFDDERLITIETVNGLISGFVKTFDLRQTHSGWQVRGKVQEIGVSTIKVLIFGSFMTTNGIANIPRHLAMAA